MSNTKDVTLLSLLDSIRCIDVDDSVVSALDTMEECVSKTDKDYREQRNV